MEFENIDEAGGQAFQKPDMIYDACPHCGQKLSPWQKVLLSVDRALVCRNCWYRIILDISATESDTAPLRAP